MRTRYVCGFMFDEDMTRVVLIRKNRPEWQKGKLNGVGGKVEETDWSPEIAMCREFEEETGVSTVPNVWESLGEIAGTDYLIYFYYCNDNDAISMVRTETDEPVIIIHTKDLRDHDVVTNLLWLIPMCADPQHSYFHSTNL